MLKLATFTALLPLFLASNMTAQAIEPGTPPSDAVTSTSAIPFPTPSVSPFQSLSSDDSQEGSTSDLATPLSFPEPGGSESSSSDGSENDEKEEHGGVSAEARGSFVFVDPLTGSTIQTMRARQMDMIMDYVLAGSHVYPSVNISSWFVISVPTLLSNS